MTRRVEQPWTLDLEVFEGPFDLLVTLILNEDVDLLEVHLAEIVLAYIERLEARGELDLEAATEFLILIAALLELKSRLMLPVRGRGGPRPRARRGGRGAARTAARVPEVQGRIGVDARAVRRRAAVPLPRRAAAAGAAPRRVRGGRAGVRARRGSPTRCAALLRTPPAVDTSHMTAHHGVARAPAGGGARAARDAAARFTFEDAVGGDSDRMTQAVTLFALLELYKNGELVWRQRETFGAIEIMSPAEVMNPIARQLTALLFCSPEPVSRADLCEAIGCAEPRLDDAIEELRDAVRAAGDRHRAARGRRRADARVRPRGRRRRAPPAVEAAHAAAVAGAGGVPFDRRLPAAGVASGDRAHPRRELRLPGDDAGGARPDRGEGPHAVRRDPLPHDARCSRSSSASSR